MKVCFPISEDFGVKSTVYGHFNSAPFFLVVDTDTKETLTIANCDPKNPLAGCDPFSALKVYNIDGIIAGCMGDSALQAMNLCGFRVFEAESENLIENMELFKQEKLQESVVQNSAAEGRCSDGESSSGEGCGHDHDHEH
jgi:predicted Fe-Mo cluster-binding NifX family protein